VGKLERKRPLGKPKHRWVDNIKMDLREIRWGLLAGLVSFRIGKSGELLLIRIIIINNCGLVRERTIPTKRPQLFVEVSANFCEYRMPRD
jgi:hypothetical protein